MADVLSSFVVLQELVKHAFLDDDVLALVQLKDNVWNTLLSVNIFWYAIQWLVWRVCVLEFRLANESPHTVLVSAEHAHNINKVMPGSVEISEKMFLLLFEPEWHWTVGAKGPRWPRLRPAPFRQTGAVHEPLLTPLYQSYHFVPTFLAPKNFHHVLWPHDYDVLFSLCHTSGRAKLRGLMGPEHVVIVVWKINFPCPGQFSMDNIKPLLPVCCASFMPRLGVYLPRMKASKVSGWHETSPKATHAQKLDSSGQGSVVCSSKSVLLRA